MANDLSFCMFSHAYFQFGNCRGFTKFSANVALSTDYMYRGGSQTLEQAAISGGFDYGHSSGIYIGTWASNIDFGDSANIEIDVYGGIAGEFSNGIAWDIGGLYYAYPGVKGVDDAGGDFDFAEAYGSLGYTFGGMPLEPSLGVFFAWSPDYFGEVGDSYYVAVDVGFSLPYGIGLAFQYGNQMFDDEAAAGTDYSHYSVGLSKDISIFTLDGTWYGDVEDTDDFWGDGPSEALVFTISSSF
ncbi:MAG: TorF family putative porin [Proteobacteria bacterium]|nr:TorF family putative porin [Pseudomonadota bacterium]